MDATEKAIVLEHIARLGPPPFHFASSELHLVANRIWGNYALDWGICGPRGNPDDRAGLRGIRRTGPDGRGFSGDYLDADEVRSLLESPSGIAEVRP